MKRYSIGEKIVLDKEVKFEKYISGNEVIAPKGTRGIVTSRGDILLLSGSAQQNIVKGNLEVKGYDTANIAVEVVKRLQLEFEDIKDFFDDYGISGRDFADVIDGVLDSTLN